MSIREYIIKQLCESDEMNITEKLYKALIESIREAFGLSEPMASKEVKATLRELYG